MSTRLMRNITSVVLSITTAVFVSGAVFVVPAQALTTAEQIQQLLNQIQALQAQLLALQGSGPVGAACTFTRSLFLGVTGDDVKCLQQYLNGAGFQVAASGAGAPGSETTYYGSRTKAAVAAWQAANGVTPSVGYFGPISQAKYGQLAGGPGPTPSPLPSPGASPTPVPPGTGLAVATSGSQPASGLHPDNALRVCYTKVDFTASADGEVTVDSVTVERRGISTDATFSGVVLVDEKEVQLGTAKTLNSNHQATLTEDFKVPAGQTRTMCIGGNRGTAGSNGANASFAVMGVAAKSGAAVSGSFPITGTTHTMNVGGVTIGTATVETGPAKTVATTTEDIGKEVVFQATKVSAGSTEDIRLLFFRWNQVGTAAIADIGDLTVKVDGTVYPHAVSSDGKYVTADLSPGIVITKGNNKEITLRGKLLHSNRTYQMDVQKKTDMGFKGELYGYGIDPSISTGFTSGTEPTYWAANFTTRKGGTLNLEKDPNVTAQNIAVNVGDQNLGGFVVDVKGEPISVGGMVFRVAPTNVAGGSTETAADVTQVKIVKSDGTILAGPVDGAAAGTATFSDTVTFPIGLTRIKLIGKLGTAFDSNDTISASTTPGTNFTTVTGDESNETITPTPSSAVTSNVMTVKAGSLTVSVSATPAAQTVVSGVNQFTFATYQFDATQSGEDVRFTTVPMNYSTNGTASNLTSCQLYRGTTSITSGSNVLNPSAAGSSTSFTFDGEGFVIPKGTTVNLDLKCNIAGGATGSFYWGIASTASFSPVGLTSGQTITPTVNTAAGQRMTLSSGGSYTVVNNSTPGYRVINSGSTGVTLLRLRVAALDEDLALQRLAFNLGTGANNPLTGIASNTPSNLINNDLKIYDEANPTVLLGTAQFTNNGDFATSSLLFIPASGTEPARNFIIPKGVSKDLMVKGDIANIGTGGSDLSRSGDLLTVNYDGQALGINGGNYGTGQSSGTNIASGSTADTDVGGVRILKSYPEFAKLAVPANVLRTGDNVDPLYRFSVRAVGNDVHVFKFTFNVGSTTISGNAPQHATTSKYTLTAYTDSAFTLGDTNSPGAGTAAGVINGGQCYGNGEAVGQNNSIGLAGDEDIEIFPTATCNTATTTYKVPAGITRYFELRANITSVEQSGSVQDSLTVRLRGDAAWPTTQQNPELGGGGASNVYVGDMGQSGIATTTKSDNNAGVNQAALRYGVDADTNNDFIWSPGSTSTSPTVYDFDFANGYQMPGLPGTDMSAETFTSTN